MQELRYYTTEGKGLYTEGYCNKSLLHFRGATGKKNKRSQVRPGECPGTRPEHPSKLITLITENERAFIPALTTAVCVHVHVSGALSVSIVFPTLLSPTSIYASPWVDVYYSLEY